VIRLARFGRAAKAGGAAGRSSPLRGTANLAPAIASIVTDRLHLALTWPATLGRQTRLSAAGDAQIDLFRYLLTLTHVPVAQHERAEAVIEGFVGA